LLAPGDQSHAKAREVFDRLASMEAALATTSYVLVETYSLVTRRLGLEAARGVHEKISPLLDVLWVAGDLHDRGLERFFRRGSRSFSLVDAVSFEVLNDHPADAVFVFDRHFEDEGFRVLE
jgi:predicted nucleic acid-binding protein